MPIDYSFLQDAIPQQEEKVHGCGMCNVTIRVDADCFLQCDGEYIDIQITGGVPVKVQLPCGQHLLEFINTGNPNIKVEKSVDFPETGKNYLVLVNELKAQIAPPMPQMPNPSPTPSNPYLDQLNSMQGYNPLQGFGSMSQTPPPMPKKPNDDMSQQPPIMPKISGDNK